jgi:hypothetical protein
MEKFTLVQVSFCIVTLDEEGVALAEPLGTV